MGQGRRRLLEMESVEAAGRAACVGRVVRIEPTGDVFVDFPDNVGSPVRARVATCEPLKTDDPVLLIFDADAGLPVVTGAVQDGLRRQEPRRVLSFEATDEITIVCGKSSISLRSDGRVVIKGTELVSRAAGTNKIRGAAVKIN